MAVVLGIIDPPVSTVPGRNTSGLHRPGRHCSHQARTGGGGGGGRRERDGRDCTHVVVVSRVIHLQYTVQDKDGIDESTNKNKLA